MLFFIIILAHGCSTIKSSLRVFGGIDAKPEEYPYVVRIEVQKSFNFTNSTVIAKHKSHCTASALSEVWLITCAHCLTNKYPIIERGKDKNGPSYTVTKLVIRYGHVESSPWMKDSIVDVLETVTHPRFMFYRSKTKGLKFARNDIALIKTSPIKISSYLKVSAVDYKTFYGQEAVLGGFGIMAMKDADGKLVIKNTLNFRKPLQILNVLVTKCHRGAVFVPGLCLSPTCERKSTVCPGDSGGPVMHPSGLIALISGGRTCHKVAGRIDNAGQVTPVSPYIEWIYSYVNT